MPLAREQRKLAAIVAADVVGYSRLMGRDESGTLARLRKNRSEHLSPVLSKYGGRLVKLTGDGALIEFASAVDALSASIEFQQAMAEINSDQPADNALVFRMGLHLGDLIVDGDDLYGDGVNIAARLEAEAPSGGIVISRAVHEAVTGRVKVTVEDLGSLTLKNIERPIQAFSVKWEPPDWPLSVTSGATATPATELQAPLPLPDKPSIAVLPFQNMSGDPEQEYFADGMVEDIITALSRTRQLFVIARNSTFSYKGKSPDIREVGHALGVRYVLEGSVRRSSQRVRITGQLIEAATGAHIWADRFDGDLREIFDLQDEVTARVVGAISPALEKAEIARARRKVGDLPAYDLYLRGLAVMYNISQANIAQAITLFEQAFGRDPELAIAYAADAFCYVARRSMGWDHDRARDITETERVSRAALALDRGDARVLAYAGHALRFVVGRYEEAGHLLDGAVEADPNLAVAWGWRGGARIGAGDFDAGIADLKHAIRLSPLEALTFLPRGQMAMAHYLLGQFDEACTWAQNSLEILPTHVTALRVLVAAHAMAGRLDKASDACVRYMELEPGVRVSNVRQRLALQREQDIGKFEEGLRRAGMPE
jgi:adenylate cyclase